MHVYLLWVFLPATSIVRRGEQKIIDLTWARLDEKLRNFYFYDLMVIMTSIQWRGIYTVSSYYGSLNFVSNG